METEPDLEGALCPPHCILDRKKVHRLAAEHLQSHPKFQDYKRKTSARTLWSLLLAPAAGVTALPTLASSSAIPPPTRRRARRCLATLPDYATPPPTVPTKSDGHQRR